MPPRDVPTPEPNEIAELRTEIADLRQHIRVLIDVMDGIREELSWLARNGVPREEPLAPIPVLKQMAADPCDPRWGEKLVIVRGDERRDTRTTTDAPQEEAMQIAEHALSSPQRPELAEFFEGDAVEFEHDGRDAFGEIVAIDAARDTATVMLVPGGEHVDMPLGRLDLVPPEDEDESEEQTETETKADDGKAVTISDAPPGKLFAEPGDQKRLF